MMRRILVLNNYPLDGLGEEVKRKEAPDHLLFGVNYLEAAGFQVCLAAFGQSKKLVRLNGLLRILRFPLPIGDLDQQWSAWKLGKQCDLIYAPCQAQTSLLALLRCYGKFKVPIVAIAHHPLNRGRLVALRRPFLRQVVSGTDAFPALSQKVADEIRGYGGSASKSEALVWGPDADFYPPAEYPGEGVVCAGRTGRDFVTFGMAASNAKIHAHLICTASTVREEFSRFSSHVRLQVEPNVGWMKYPDLARIYARARVLAIPVYAAPSIVGLTSFMDALGMGKPVIMTRLPIFDFDIEAMGVGKWVAPGDLAGWEETLKWFEEHPNEAAAMGKQARAFVERGLNSRTFAHNVVQILLRTLNHS